MLGISIEEVWEAVNKIKPGKAMGWMVFQYCWKKCGLTVLEWLVRFLN